MGNDATSFYFEKPLKIIDCCPNVSNAEFFAESKWDVRRQVRKEKKEDGRTVPLSSFCLWIFLQVF